MQDIITGVSKLALTGADVRLIEFSVASKTRNMLYKCQLPLRNG